MELAQRQGNTISGRISLAYWLALSVAVHLVFLAPLARHQPVSTPATGMKVAILDTPRPGAVSVPPSPLNTPIEEQPAEAPSAATANQPQVRISEKPTQQPVPKKTPAAPQQNHVKKQPALQNKTMSPATTPARADPEIGSRPEPDHDIAMAQHQEREQTRQAVIAAIHQRLARHFHYPAIARRRGWEGEVLLSFHLSPTGRLSRQQVIKGSGHRILDRAALKALSYVERLEWVELPLRMTGMVIEVPVIYQLKEG